VTTDCLTCGGAGEITECANDGTHGCSHQYDRIWPCPDCDNGQAVGYGCPRSRYCGGIAYFPSKPGDYCERCRIEAADAAKDAYLETLS
jgi:hypothetical protein